MLLFLKPVFQHIGRDSSMRAQVDAFHYSAIIHACTLNKDFENAMVMFEECKKNKTIIPSRYVYAAAMKACIKAENFSRALNIFEEMTERKIKIDSTVYNIALDAAARAGAHVKCLLMFSKMEEMGIRQDIIGFTAILSSCNLSGDWKEAIGILEIMKSKKWLQPNLKTYTIVISACIRGNSPERALDLFKEYSLLSSRNANLKADIDSSNEVDITSHPDFADDPRTNRNRLKQDKVRVRPEPPDGIMISLCIAACAKENSGKYAIIAVQLLQQMIDFKLKPSYMCFSNTLKALEIAGNIVGCMDAFFSGLTFGYFSSYLSDIDIQSVMRKRVDYMKHLKFQNELLSQTSRNSTLRIKIEGSEAHIIRTRLHILCDYILTTHDKADNHKAINILLILG